MFKRFIVTGVVGLAVLGVAVPAWAHEEVNPSTIGTGKPVFFTLSAANEAKADLVKIGITAPKSVPMGATTREPSGWTVSTKDTSAVVWQAASGAGVKPDKFETWGFETDGADQPGAYTYKVALTFADGKTTNVDVPLAVGTPPSTGGSTATTTPAGTGGAGATTTVAPATTAAPKAKKTSNRATLALIVGAIALVVSLISLAVGLSRRRTTPAAGAPSAGKDW
jgi:hypothetical protein